MNIGGIDGARSGWVLTSIIEGKYDLKVYNNFINLVEDNPQLQRVFIDVPIGLSSKSHKRTIEVLLRKQLKGRGSTVFNVPCRKAVYELDDSKAKELNMEIEGKSLSIQSLSIRNKIREIDEFILKQSHPLEIIESHPEFCFKKLNNNKVLQTKKNNTKGLEERLTILENHDKQLIKLYNEKQNKIPRYIAQKDDLIDSMSLCLANKVAVENKLTFLEDKNNIDEKGIKIRIGTFNYI